MTDTPALGTWDLGWIKVDVVMVGETFGRDGTPTPVALIDVPGLGMTRLRGNAATYWEVAIVDLLG